MDKETMYKKIVKYFENEIREYVYENYITDTKWTKKEAAYYLGLSDAEARTMTKEEVIEAAIEQQKEYFRNSDVCGAELDEVCEKFLELI
jgi:hypothetical protein